MSNGTTSLSKAESSALAVSYDVLGAHVNLDIDFVKKYLVRGKADMVSDQEVILFMNTCAQSRLNPIANEAYLIKYSPSDPAQIVVGKGAYLRRAFEHPDYIGKTDGITVARGNEIFQKEGCCLYPGETLIGGWCRVMYNRAGAIQSAFKEVSFSEYDKGQANWKSKPATMINKVAVSQCVREAFPKDYEGLYSEDEMIASGAVPINENGDVIVDLDNEATDDDPPITQEQRQTLFRTAQSAFGRNEGNEIVKSIIDELGLENTSSMKSSTYSKAMERLFEICEAAKESEAQRSCEQPDTE